jgi:cytochrome d ubiquinol oxidase subunit II
VWSRSPASSSSTRTPATSTTGWSTRVCRWSSPSALCGAAALLLLWRDARRGVRVLAVGAVVAVIWGWGIAQYPYLLPEKLTVADGAAGSETLTALLVVFGVALLLVVPALALLYTLDQRTVLEEEAEP